MVQFHSLLNYRYSFRAIPQSTKLLPLPLISNLVGNLTLCFMYLLIVIDCEIALKEVLLTPGSEALSIVACELQ